MFLHVVIFLFILPLSFKNNDNQLYLKGIVFLKVRAKSAASGPPIGPALGQCSIPAAPFCKEFNERTSMFKSNVILSVTLYIFLSGEYNFDIELPSTSFLIRRAVSFKFGLSKPGFYISELRESKNPKSINRYRYLTPYILYEIFLYKILYNNWSKTYAKSYCKKSLGTLKSIGIFFIFNL